MLRDEWRFVYTAAQLHDAAVAQLMFRNERITVWEQTKADVISRIKDSGIDVDESLAAEMSNNTAKYLSTHSHRGPQITINATMQKDLDECFLKIRHHTDMRNQYKAWVQVLAAQPPESTQELQHDDWMFFFGK